jgi:hypothetical protein
MAAGGAEAAGARKIGAPILLPLQRSAPAMFPPADCRSMMPSVDPAPRLWGRLMFRKLFIAAAALAASACSYGSAVDIAPMSARLAQPVLPAGDYCEVKGAQGAYLVSSHEDCAPLVWNAEPHTYTMVDKEKPDESVEAAVAPLGDGLFATQF